MKIGLAEEKHKSRQLTVQKDFFAFKGFLCHKTCENIFPDKSHFWINLKKEFSE